MTLGRDFSSMEKMERLFRGASVSGASLSRSNRSISCSSCSRISPRIQFNRFLGGIRITVARNFSSLQIMEPVPLLRFLPHHRAQPCCPSRSSCGNNVLMFPRSPVPGPFHSLLSFFFFSSLLPFSFWVNRRQRALFRRFPPLVGW